MSTPAGAVYLVKNENIDTYKNEIEEADLLVCTPDIDMVRLDAINPGASRFLYFHSTAFPLYGVGNPVYDGYRMKMGPHYAKDASGMPVFNKKSDGTPWSVEIEFSLAAAEDLAEFIGSTMMLAGAAGVYLDQNFTSLPPWLQTLRNNPRDNKRWPHYVTHLIELIKLRGFPVIGNIGSPVEGKHHKHLDGITIEEDRLIHGTMASKTFGKFLPANNVAWTDDDTWDFPFLCSRGYIFPDAR